MGKSKYNEVFCLHKKRTLSIKGSSLIKNFDRNYFSYQLLWATYWLPVTRNVSLIHKNVMWNTVAISSFTRCKPERFTSLVGANHMCNQQWHGLKLILLADHVRIIKFQSVCTKEKQKQQKEILTIHPIPISKQSRNWARHKRCFVRGIFSPSATACLNLGNSLFWEGRASYLQAWHRLEVMWSTTMFKNKTICFEHRSLLGFKAITSFISFLKC